MNDNKSYNELSLRRDSFSDRFCDDLSEVLLSFVSFEDKIRFECVSHQFQRLLFNKQYFLRIPDFRRFETRNSCHQLFKRIKQKYFDKREIDLIAFESVLKKCKFIKEIVFDINDTFNNTIQNREKTLLLITKYLKYLKSIHFYFEKINENVLFVFENCGQKLEHLDLVGFHYLFKYDYKPLLKLCPNIRSLTNIKLEDIVENNDLLVPKIMSIKLLSLNSNNNLFETFVNKTQNSLKYLGISIYDFFANRELAIKQFKSITLLVNLEELRLYCYDMDVIQCESLRDVLHCIGFKCKKIKKLLLHINDYRINGKKFNFFKTFTQLRQLSVNFWSILVKKSLQNCKQLTHFKITTYRFQKETFNEINSCFPQLRHFDCTIHWSVTDNQFKLLANFKHLKCLIIRQFQSVYYPLTEEGICHIINNCPEITSIRFDETPRRHKLYNTIDALISLAERKPFYHFVHSFGPKPYESEQHFDYLKFLTNKKYQNWPKNMSLIPFDSHIFAINGTNSV